MSGLHRLSKRGFVKNGAIAQLGERLPCTQEVSGSIPLSSTIYDECKAIELFSSDGSLLAALCYADYL